MRELRAIFAVCAVMAVCAWLGGAAGDRLLEFGRVLDRRVAEDETARVARVLAAAADRSAEPFDTAEALYGGALPAALAVLDPHSKFFDSTEFVDFRERQQGSYAGVGMQVSVFRGEPVVDFAFPGTPAFQAGIRPGDVIREIDGAPTKGYDADRVAREVRGEEGAEVRLGLSRLGVAHPIEVELVRGRIPRPSIPQAFFVRSGIGYLRVEEFTETTPAELDRALTRLQTQGLNGLVLDLRDNGGGLLSAGVYVAGRFLPAGSTVASHRGRGSRERVYRSRRGRDGLVYPMTVLVNCRSASASEIVAGALQDHDRALIVGQRTFGKALVQSVHDLSTGTGLILTSARYYTPSGRMIQRPYDGFSGESYYEEPCRDDYAPPTSRPLRTAAGREVRGGAGIRPDASWPKPRPTPLENSLRNARLFERFALAMRAAGDRVDPSWDVTPETLRLFRGFARATEIDFDDGAFREAEPAIRRLLRSAVHTVYFDVERGAQAETELDPEVRRAADLLGEAAILLRDAAGAAASRRMLGDD